MNCQHCQHCEATVHIQEIVNGVKTSLHLCHNCAEVKGLAANKVTGIDLATLIYNLTQQSTAAIDKQPETAAETAASQCRRCGHSSESFRKTGRLGCAGCYEQFAEILSAAFEQMHRGSVHCGKHPAEAATAAPSPPIETKLAWLNEQLNRAIAAEAYEQAADIRDQIKQLSGGRQPLQCL